MDLDAAIFARVKTLPTVTTSMARVSAAQAGLVTRVVRLVPRADTGQAVSRSANVRTEPHVILPTENVTVLLVGQVMCTKQDTLKRI